MTFKTFTKILALCLVPAIFYGQSIQRAVNIGGAQNFTLELIMAQIARNQPASLVLLDTQDKAWAEEFGRIRREDPFAALNLPFIPLEIDQGAGNELREREGWQQGSPHWAIFNNRGRAVADGSGLPSAAMLADACAGASIISKVEAYRRFLRENPNHQEARGAMLNEMIAVAEIRTRNALQVPESRRESTIMALVNNVRFGNQNEDGPTDEQIENLPELASDADERIWRDYCIEFQHHLEGALWQAGAAPANANSSLMSIVSSALSGRRIVSAWAIYSPMARAAYARAAAKAEAALERQPTSSALWDLWVTFKKCRAGLPMKELLANLQPSPTVAAANWPPPSVRQAYITACREAGDWQSIQDLVEPRWGELVSTSQLMNQGQLAQRLRERVGESDINVGSLVGFNQGFWASNGEAYLEALLRQGRLADAERMMNEWESASGWPGAFLAAADMAEKLGYDSAAKAWRKKGEKK